MLVVLAGNEIEAKNWLRERKIDPRDVIVVKSFRSIEGLRFRGSDVVYLGSWRDQTDLDDIQEVISHTVVMMGPGVEVCPECEAGKCTNCDGRSWDNQKDGPAPCPCEVRGHPRRTA